MLCIWRAVLCQLLQTYMQPLHPLGSLALPWQLRCRYLRDLSDEDRERRADGLFTEFLSSNDEKEAVLCAHELAVRCKSLCSCLYSV